MLREMLWTMGLMVIVGTPPTLMIPLGVRFGVNKALVVAMAVILATAFAFVVESHRRKRWVFQRREK